jgi:hypothetical protein
VGRDKKSTRHFDAARSAVAGIPFGQPILVGHHSEKRHRAAVDRSDRNMRNACESSDMAKHHRSKAAGIEHQLDNSIFSDDPDAIEALEARIAELSERREKMKASNKAFKKGDGPWAELLGISEEAAAAARVRIMDSYSWTQRPHPAYELTNLGGNIRRLKKRVDQVKTQQARSAEAEEAGGIAIEIIASHSTTTGDYARVTFAEKPDRSILNELKAAGFSWSSGSWLGYEPDIPASVRELTA